MNKVRFIFCLILTLFSFDSLAQILVGPVVAAHSDWVSFKDGGSKDEWNVKNYWGYSVGGSLSFRVRKQFFLQTSILYSRKGKTLTDKTSNPLYDGDFSNKVKYNYLEMPILYTIEFKGKLGKKSNREFKWYVGAGPTVSYWLGGKGVLTDGDLVEVNVSSLPYRITFDKDPEDVKRGEMNVEDANRIQLALNITSGLILEPVGFNKIIVAARYEFGHSYFSRTNDGYFGGFDGDLYYADDLQVRMQSISISLYYYIDLKTDQRNKGKSTIKTKKGRPK